MMTRRFALALLCLALPACDAVMGDSQEERRALDIEVNEALTISHLRSIQGAQMHFQTLALLDADQDGVGEFAYLAELSGAARLRGTGATIKFPLLPSDFKRLSSDHFIQVHGYLYRIFMPGADGEPLGEGARTQGDVDVDAAERTWVVYAWPLQHGETGRRTFFLAATGALHAADLEGYSGGKGPEAFDALTGAGDLRGEVRTTWPRVD